MTPLIDPIPKDVTSRQRAMQVIQSAETIGIISHQRPDSDAFGSTYALGLALRSLGKKVKMINPSVLPDKFMALGGSEFIQPAQVQRQDLDLLITVDCASIHELGPTTFGWGVDINIDHHKGNKLYGGLNLVSHHYPANCAHLIDIFISWGIPITKTMAAALYLGLIGDTGNFRYPGVTSETFLAASVLARTGIDLAILADIEASVDNAVLAAAPAFLARAQRYAGGKLLLLHVPYEDYITYKEDWVPLKEYILETLSRVEGVEIYGFLRWVSPVDLVGSMRSRRPWDMNAFCQDYSGGGHAQAAGLHVRDATSKTHQEILAGLLALLESHKG